MAVMNVFGFDVLPGKALEFQDLLGRAVAVAMANGSPPPRIWQVALGGPNTGTTVVAVEYDDIAAYAAQSERIAAVEEWTALLPEFQAVCNVSSSLLNEVTG
ncbi:MAG: NIPSNAP family protein [Chloroflexi bacterium]|nr:NIPSNAP family protein [Chloroflexota bacterium]MCZ6708478.1 NIPSNAP family protein [Chloroflexota bacterium]